MKQNAPLDNKTLYKMKSPYTPPRMSFFEVELSRILTGSNERFQTDPEFEM